MSGAVIVTGASRGVGRATALALAARGLPLVLIGRESKLHAETASLAREAGAPEVMEAFADFSSAPSLERAASAAVERFGPPRAVVHNAGVVRRARIEALSVDAWDEQLDVNLRAPFVLTRALLAPMRAARAGRFVFVGSISSTIGSPGASGYAASKWGLVGFVKSLAEELTDSGVIACALLPGSIDTDMLQGSGFPPRMTAAEVATTLTFLALEAPAAHNGAVIEMFGT